MTVIKMRPRNVWSTFVVASVTLLSGCAGTSDQASEVDTAAAMQLWTELGPNQAKAEKFFAYDNIPDITINLSQDVWDSVKYAEPIGGHCTQLEINDSGETPERYVWQKAGAVTVKDLKDNQTAVNFDANVVEIRKKSHCGSATDEDYKKPSLRLKFTNSAAQSAMGVQYLTLNNSKQDPSFIRQTLGYYLYDLAGVPHPRANYAKVHIVTPNGTEDYVYVNVESFRGSLINNPKNGFTNRTITQSGSSDAKAKGNLYEIAGADFNADGLKYIGTEKISAIQGKARPDLTWATAELAKGTVAAVQNVVNVDQFAKFWAMEVLLKHWDGYTVGANNTYVYNDVVATSGTQSASTVDFKFIPSGIDQILQPDRNFVISENSVVNRILRKDATMFAKFIAAVGSVRGSVFSRALLDGDIKTRIDTLNTQLLGLGIDASAEIGTVRIQLKLARAAAIMLSGSGSPSFYIADVNTGDVMHGSASESDGIYKEVYHRPQQDAATDRWTEGWNSYGMTLTNEGTGMALYASVNMKTAAGHVVIYQEPVGNYASGEAWNYEYDGTRYSDGEFSDFPGTFQLRSNRTDKYAHFSGSDLTPNGNPRVYQGGATKLFLY